MLHTLDSCSVGWAWISAAIFPDKILSVGPTQLRASRNDGLRWILNQKNDVVKVVLRSSCKKSTQFATRHPSHVEHGVLSRTKIGWDVESLGGRLRVVGCTKVSWEKVNKVWVNYRIGSTRLWELCRPPWAPRRDLDQDYADPQYEQKPSWLPIQDQTDEARWAYLVP